MTTPSLCSTDLVTRVRVLAGVDVELYARLHSEAGGSASNPSGSGVSESSGCRPIPIRDRQDLYASRRWSMSTMMICRSFSSMR